MKTLLFGPRGHLGRHFQKIYPQASLSDADIADADSVSSALEEHHPDIVINCAGKTGSPNVDWCEDHKEETLRSNVLGPLVLLEACAKRRIFWMHLSTGCIYEGDKNGEGFAEDDPPNFSGSFYSRTKGWADQILRDFADAPPDSSFRILQLRLRMPFDDTPNPRNLITKLIRYPRVLDCENSLTSVPDFLIAAKTLIERGATGTYNIVNPDTMTPYRIMELYRKIVDPTHPFKRLTLKELPTAVRAGRSNCTLSTKKLEAAGIRLQPVEEAVRKALISYRDALKHAGTP